VIVKVNEAGDSNADRQQNKSEGIEIIGSNGPLR
jgi:hypothetical protein